MKAFDAIVRARIRRREHLEVMPRQDKHHNAIVIWKDSSHLSSTFKMHRPLCACELA